MNIGNIGQITPSAEGEVKLNDVGESNDVGCGVSTGVNIGGQNGVELRNNIHTDGQNSKNDCGVEYRDMNMDDCGIVDNSEMIVECEFVRGTCKNHRIKGTRKVTRNGQKRSMGLAGLLRRRLRTLVQLGYSPLVLITSRPVETQAYRQMLSKGVHTIQITVIYR